MIFGNKSELMLKYQKAKAKLVEYDTPIDQYPHFTHNSNELSYPTTYILSRYAECIVANNSPELSELSPFLAATAQYTSAEGVEELLKAVGFKFYKRMVDEKLGSILVFEK